MTWAYHPQWAKENHQPAMVILILVKPGSVFTSLTTTLPSGVKKTSTRAMPAQLRAMNACRAIRRISSLAALADVGRYHHLRARFVNVFGVIGIKIVA